MSFMDNSANFPTYLSPYYENNLSKLEFLFSALGSMVSSNMYKLRHKFNSAKN